MTAVPFIAQIHFQRAFDQRQIFFSCVLELTRIRHYAVNSNLSALYLKEIKYFPREVIWQADLRR